MQQTHCMLNGGTIKMIFDLWKTVKLSKIFGIHLKSSGILKIQFCLSTYLIFLLIYLDDDDIVRISIETIRKTPRLMSPLNSSMTE